MENKYLEQAERAMPDIPCGPASYAKYAARYIEAVEYDKARRIFDFFEKNVFASGDEKAAGFWKSLFISPLYEGGFGGKAIYTLPETRGTVYEMLGRSSRLMWDMYGEYLRTGAELSAMLDKELPDPDYEDGETELPYMAAGRAAEHIISLFVSGDTKGTRKWLEFIERLCADRNPYISELGVIGYLEDMQNRLDDDTELIPLLGEHSLKGWRELRLWLGEAEKGKDNYDS